MINTVLLIIVALLGFAISLLITNKNESSIVRQIQSSVFVNAFLLFGLGIVLHFGGEGRADLLQENVELFNSIHLSFMMDGLSEALLWLTNVLMFLVINFSRVYLHKEEGFKRFFNALALFYLALHWTLLANNFSTLLIGWELLGLASYLLITFYRDRFLPVNNALKVFSIYRIGDLGLILAMWCFYHATNVELSFDQAHLWFSQHAHAHVGELTVASAFLLLAAAAKSGIFPFSTWLPRALEGPTPSSAIFYGALSVHMGIYLLLRTESLWFGYWQIHALLITFGLITAAMCYQMSISQANVKSQIAYAAISQIGLMWFELGLGLPVAFILLHLVSNACLRAYQLLSSPSVVTYLIKEQKFLNNTLPDSEKTMSNYKKKWFAWSLQEFGIEAMMDKYWWNPLQMLGEKFQIIKKSQIQTLLMGLFCLFVLLHLVLPNAANAAPMLIMFQQILSFLLITSALVLSLMAYVSQDKPIKTWMSLVKSQLFAMLGVNFLLINGWSFIDLELISIFVVGATGYYILNKLAQEESKVVLNEYCGHVLHHPKFTHFFLVCCLSLYGFPVSPIFIGMEDIIYSLGFSKYFFMLLLALTLFINAIAAIRLFSYVFLGPSEKLGYAVPRYTS